MANGLIGVQEIIEIRLHDLVTDSPKVAIDRVLTEKPLHRIISMSVTSAQEFNTAGIALLVIEYLDQGLQN